MDTMVKTRKVVVLFLREDIDIEDILALKGIISSFIEKENYYFILDFTKVDHVNVSGIEHLNERKARCRNLGGDIKITGASDYVKSLFTYAGYWGEFDFFANEDEAIRAFENLI